MSSLSQFTAAFCTVCIMTGVLYVLCPKGALQQSVKYVFSLIFVVCIMSALPGLKGISADFLKNENNIVINEEMQNTAIRLTFEVALANSGIEFSKITVCTDKLPDGSIKITKVEVITPELPETVRKVLGGEDCAYTVEVHA
ncbi:MAG: hypothetical protein E7562_05425 [Ruminococcaceae bacterium]|nr:hypothetical protein [Oscillospiraceae bacterium]